MSKDPLSEFMNMVEREYDQYRKYCQHPEDVELVHSYDCIEMVHCGKIIKRWDNPFNDNIIIF